MLPSPKLLTLFFDGAVVVFNLNKPGNISRALSGEQIGTLIDDTGLNLTTSWIPKSRLPISTEDLWITMHFRVTFFFLLNPEGCIIVGYMSQYWISVSTTSPWEILETWVFHTVNWRSFNSSSVVDQSRRVFLLRASTNTISLRPGFDSPAAVLLA